MSRHTGHDGRQPAGQVVDAGRIGSTHPRSGLLHGVVSVGRRAEHAYRDQTQARPDGERDRPADALDDEFNDRADFHAMDHINREDWRPGPPSAFDASRALVSMTIRLEIETELIRRQ
jgi:hypothetical protein